MSVGRNRKEDAKRLGIALQVKNRAMMLATGQEEIVKTSSDLAQHMIENIDFVIAVLKDYGGMDVRFERLKNAPARCLSTASSVVTST